MPSAASAGVIFLCFASIAMYWGPSNQCNMKRLTPVQSPVWSVTTQPTVVFHSVHNHEVSSLLSWSRCAVVWAVEDAKQHFQWFIFSEDKTEIVTACHHCHYVMYVNRIFFCWIIGEKTIICMKLPTIFVIMSHYVQRKSCEHAAIHFVNKFS